LIEIKLIAYCSPLEITRHPEVLIHIDRQSPLMAAGLVVLLHEFALGIPLLRVSIQPEIDRSDVREGGEAKLANKTL
jgi:hypothetical protein